jgi:hypothetical protein
MARKQCFLVCSPLGNTARKECFLICPPLRKMARKQCFLVCSPSGNMARKQCSLVCSPSRNMARKQCFLVCPPLENMARKPYVYWLVHLWETWLGISIYNYFHLIIHLLHSNFHYSFESLFRPGRRKPAVRPSVEVSGVRNSMSCSSCYNIQQSRETRCRIRHQIRTTPLYMPLLSRSYGGCACLGEFPKFPLLYRKFHTRKGQIGHRTRQKCRYLVQKGLSTSKHA